MSETYLQSFISIVSIVLTGIVTYLLSTKGNKKNVLFQEEKEAITLFYSSFCIWFSEIDHAFIWDQDHRNYKNLELLEVEYHKLYNNVLVNHSRIELFINDQIIIEKATELVKKAYSVKEILLISADELFFILEDEAEIIKDNPQIERQDDLYLELSVIMKAFPEHKEKKEQLKATHNKKFNELRNEVILINNEFVKLARKYIRK